MAPRLEVLITGIESRTGSATLHAIIKGARAAGIEVHHTNRYTGNCEWLTMFGAGAPERAAARAAHLKQGGKVFSWDHGYFGRGKDPNQCYLRVSVDDLHPHRLMDKTPNDPSRWQVHNIALREDFNPNGHVVVVALGPKSRKSLDLHDWELPKLKETQARFPDRKIVYRPKPGKDPSWRVNWLTDTASSIEKLLQGASLVVCRHSNVAVDAIIAGVPFECEDGAALWLQQQTRNPTPEQRLDFLHRVAYWQWRLNEMETAWKFLQKISS